MGESGDFFFFVATNRGKRGPPQINKTVEIELKIFIVGFTFMLSLLSDATGCTTFSLIPATHHCTVFFSSLFFLFFACLSLCAMTEPSLESCQRAEDQTVCCPLLCQ